MAMETVTDKANKLREKFDNISYKGVVLNVPYLIFIALLTIMYISNSNKGLSIARQIEKKKTELKEVRWRYKNAQANLIFNTSEKQIRENAASLGIMPLDKPAFEINEFIKK